MPLNVVTVDLENVSGDRESALVDNQHEGLREKVVQLRNL